MTLQLHIPSPLGWQERERAFNRLQEAYQQEGNDYTLFVYRKRRQFEKKYQKLNTDERLVCVFQGGLKNCLNYLCLYDFSDHLFSETAEGHLHLSLTNTVFPKRDLIRHPEKETTEGVFYQMDEESFRQIPFTTHPITSRREGFASRILPDSVPLTEEVDVFLHTHLQPLSSHADTDTLMYTPIIVNRLEKEVPTTIHPKAFELAKRHRLSNFECNVLNYFYSTGKALRNGEAQMYFDVYSKGIGWRYERTWVKRKMKRLLERKLVAFESRHDCRDARYTSWYFYLYGESLDGLLQKERS